MRADSLPAELQGKPKNTGVGSLSLLQWIFPTQASNRGLLHCRWILYLLSYQGSPRTIKNHKIIFLVPPPPPSFCYSILITNIIFFNVCLCTIKNGYISTYIYTYIYDLNKKDLEQASVDTHEKQEATVSSSGNNNELHNPCFLGL